MSLGTKLCWTLAVLLYLLAFGVMFSAWGQEIRGPRGEYLGKIERGLDRDNIYDKRGQFRGDLRHEPEPQARQTSPRNFYHGTPGAPVIPYTPLYPRR